MNPPHLLLPLRFKPVRFRIVPSVVVDGKRRVVSQLAGVDDSH